MAADFEFDRAALAELARSESVRRLLDREALAIRGRARANAADISSELADAIDVESGDDADGPFADIGYRRDRPGFVLWWHEVGTVNYPATPHLRPAVQPGD